MDEFMGADGVRWRRCTLFEIYIQVVGKVVSLCTAPEHRGDDVVESKSRYLLTCELFDGNNTSFKAPFDMHPIAYCICSNH